MHPYQVDEEIRKRVYLFSTLFAVASSYLLSILINKSAIPIPWWMETPSVLAFFGLYIWLYDSLLWKIWPFCKLSWFRTPNLNGQWQVEIKSSYKDFDVTKGVAIIRQTASRLSIALQTKQSTSSSCQGILTRAEKLDTFELIYHYVNKPKAEATGTMSIHHGTAWLQISEDTNCLEGDYYTGRGRQQFGSIVFKR